MQRRARHLHQIVDRHRFRVRIHVRQLCDQHRARSARLAHADDAAAADMQPGIAHLGQRIDTVVVVAGGDDVFVIVFGGIDVVVVIVEAGVAQLIGLAGLEHAQRRAGFHAQSAHRLDHRHHLVEITLLGPAPCSAHAETRGAVFARGARRGHHLVHRQQVLVLDARLVSRRLRTITAVFGTAAGLDRQQRRQLDGIGVEIFTVHLLRAEQQIVERQREQRFDGRHGPGRCSGCIVGGKRLVFVYRIIDGQSIHGASGEL